MAPLVVPFESLLPFLRPHVSEAADTASTGHIARLDNDVYFQVIRFANYLVWSDVARLDFTFFLGPDGLPATPSLEAASRILVVRSNYDVQPVGGWWGNAEARTNLRRIRDELGSRTASMASWHVKASAKLEADDPRHWVRADFMVLPGRRKGSRGYNWEVLGRKIVASLDDIRTALETDYSR